PVVYARVFPDAESFGPPAGTPPSAAAYRDGQVAGYVFVTRDVVRSIGFSAKPLDIAAGLDLEGRITRAEIVEQHEPIPIIGITEADLDDCATQDRGLDIREAVSFVGETKAGRHRVDAVSGPPSPRSSSATR
ncbi:MAG: hypothetical protein V3U93_07420, partial [Alphaproteobacteria bacterium]